MHSFPFLDSRNKLDRHGENEERMERREGEGEGETEGERERETARRTEGERETLSWLCDYCPDPFLLVKLGLIYFYSLVSTIYEFYLWSSNSLI